MNLKYMYREVCTNAISV